MSAISTTPEKTMQQKLKRSATVVLAGMSAAALDVGKRAGDQIGLIAGQVMTVGGVLAFCLLSDGLNGYQKLLAQCIAGGVCFAGIRRISRTRKTVTFINSQQN